LDAGVWGEARYSQLREYKPHKHLNGLKVKLSDLCRLLYLLERLPFIITLSYVAVNRNNFNFAFILLKILLPHLDVVILQCDWLPV
jgi:hypothetical protein